jgi:hypothetical protein
VPAGLILVSGLCGVLRDLRIQCATLCSTDDDSDDELPLKDAAFRSQGGVS